MDAIREYHVCIDHQELLLYQVQDLSTCRVFPHVQKRDDSETEMPQKTMTKFVIPGGKSAAHRDKSREWNVSKQKWNLC